MRTSLALVLIVLLLAIPVQAQSVPGGDAYPVMGTPPAPAGTADCFQYYRFGSVQVPLLSNVTTAVSGTPITFSGAIVNENPYPIVDGALYVKVFKLQDGGAGKNGPDVVDQFLAWQGIDLPARGRVPITFTWDIPSYSSSGEYEVATYFTSAKKFNLLGLSFTDDVKGNSVPFTIVGEMRTTVAFDKEAVMVDGRPYRFAAFIPQVSADAPTRVSASLTNSTGQTVNVPVSWQLYAWDAGDPANLIASSDRAVSVPARGTTSVEYTVTDTQYPVYYLVGTAQWGNSRSIINVRFAREGLDRLRINFPGLSDFPLQPGKEVTLFSCLHNNGSSTSVPGRLELELIDDRGGLIHQYSYTGDVTGAMMGVANTFTPTRGYNVVQLSAKLYQGDALVDETRITYDCSSIDPASCLPPEAVADTSWLSGFLTSKVRYILIGAGAIALLVIFGVFVRRRSTRKSDL